MASPTLVFLPSVPWLYSLLGGRPSGGLTDNTWKKNDRHLHFTTVTEDACILARDILLLSLCLSNVSTESIFQCYFNTVYDQQCEEIVRCHVSQLLENTSNFANWTSFRVSSIIRFASEDTLACIHRVFAQWDKILNDQLCYQKAEAAWVEQRRNRPSIPDGFRLPCTDRANTWAEKAMARAMMVSHAHYWEHGTSSVQPLKKGLRMNPLLAFSQIGDACNLHVESHPLSAFHGLSGTSKPFTSENKTNCDLLTNAAHAELADWACAIRKAAKLDCVKIMVSVTGPLAACHTLRPIGKNNVKQSRLLRETYGGREWDACNARAMPTRFNIIDGRSTAGNIGFFNILLCSLPLLIENPRSTILMDNLDACPSGNVPTAYKTTCDILGVKLVTGGNYTVLRCIPEILGADGKSHKLQCSYDTIKMVRILSDAYAMMVKKPITTPATFALLAYTLRERVNAKIDWVQATDMIQRGFTTQGGRQSLAIPQEVMTQLQLYGFVTSSAQEHEEVSQSITRVSVPVPLTANTESFEQHEGSAILPRNGSEAPQPQGTLAPQDKASGAKQKTENSGAASVKAPAHDPGTSKKSGYKIKYATKPRAKTSCSLTARLPRPCASSSCKGTEPKKIGKVGWLGYPVNPTLQGGKPAAAGSGYTKARMVTSPPDLPLAVDKLCCPVAAGPEHEKDKRQAEEQNQDKTPEITEKTLSGAEKRDSVLSSVGGGNVQNLPLKTGVEGEDSISLKTGVKDTENFPLKARLPESQNIPSKPESPQYAESRTEESSNHSGSYDGDGGSHTTVETPLSTRPPSPIKEVRVAKRTHRNKSTPPLDAANVVTACGVEPKLPQAPELLANTTKEERNTRVFSWDWADEVEAHEQGLEPPRGCDYIIENGRRVLLPARVEEATALEEDSSPPQGYTTAAGKDTQKNRRAFSWDWADEVEAQEEGLDPPRGCDYIIEGDKRVFSPDRGNGSTHKTDRESLQEGDQIPESNRNTKNRRTFSWDWADEVEAHEQGLEPPRGCDYIVQNGERILSPDRAKREHEVDPEPLQECSPVTENDEKKNNRRAFSWDWADEVEAHEQGLEPPRGCDYTVQNGERVLSLNRANEEQGCSPVVENSKNKKSNRVFSWDWADEVEAHEEGLEPPQSRDYTIQNGQRVFAPGRADEVEASRANEAEARKDPKQPQEPGYATEDGQDTGGEPVQQQVRGMYIAENWAADIVAISFGGSVTSFERVVYPSLDINLIEDQVGIQSGGLDGLYYLTFTESGAIMPVWMPWIAGGLFGSPRVEIMTPDYCKVILELPDSTLENALAMARATA
ncbi:hypothetical protein DRE_01581 [Drechslerella stenobrocha 248]|uniref:Uncharacterized protein n=1 Tax=Drechslerella stenobrocha 248 TaxID=1043628 RepID=W7HKZ6_9PEZI|nr:hypothetical protein DRE_01581 [Drechslerella stenobrocha 248]